MPDLITLSCPSCGNRLQMPPRIHRFVCAGCGNEYVINRSGDTVTLIPETKKSSKVREDYYMQKWEYITIRHSKIAMGFSGGVYYILPDGDEKKFSGVDEDGANVHKLLNHFGSQGFELVGVTTTSSNNINQHCRFLYLKRQKE